MASNANNFKRIIKATALLFIAASSFLLTAYGQSGIRTKLIISDSNYFETRGLNVFVFSNHYGLFGDEKASGIETIHHDYRCRKCFSRIELYLWDTSGV